MGVVRMAWRNLWRAPRRTGIVLVAVAVGIGGVVLSMAIYNGMMFQMIETAIATELGHLQVHAPGFDQNPLLRFRLEDGGRAAMEALAGRPDVRAFARRVRSEGLVASPRANAGVRVIGIDPSAEARVSTLAETVVRGAYLDGEGRRVLLGEELATRLHVDVGSKVVLSVQDLAGDLTGEAFRVGGIFKSTSGEIDRTTIFVRLSESQSLFGLEGSISELVIVAREPQDILPLQQLLEQELGEAGVVQTWQELRPFLVQIVELFDQTGWAMYAAVFVAMMFGIANVLLMSVFERTREIGVVLALGMQPRRIVAVVVLESLWLTLLGLALGYAVAALGVFLLRDGIDLSLFARGLSWMGIGSTIVPVIRSYDLVVPITVAIVTAGIASLWPALRAAPRAGHATCLNRGGVLLLEARDLHKVYDTRGVLTRALTGVNLVVGEGEFTALAGPSGSGKTTLLNLFGGLDEPTAGEVILDGERLSELGPRALADLRLHKLGFVFQAYNLIPVFSARENVEFVMQLQGLPSQERRQRAETLLEAVGLGELADKRPLEMSGGQQQRVAVARAIASRPRVVLADEPTANLDSETARNLLDLMQRLNEERGITFLFSTHDPQVMEVARRLVRLHDGRVASDEVRTAA